MFNILDNAKSFYLAAERCLEFRENKILLIPSIVNCAFACELYIKCILNKSNINFGKQHSLEKLFALLPENTKNKVVKNIADEDFNKNLQNISNTFIEWRYLYERDTATCEINFLMNFTKILKVEAETQM